MLWHPLHRQIIFLRPRWNWVLWKDLDSWQNYSAWSKGVLWPWPKVLSLRSFKSRTRSNFWSVFEIHFFLKNLVLHCSMICAISSLYVQIYLIWTFLHMFRGLFCRDLDMPNAKQAGKSLIKIKKSTSSCIVWIYQIALSSDLYIFFSRDVSGLETWTLSRLVISYLAYIFKLIYGTMWISVLLVCSCRLPNTLKFRTGQYICMTFKWVQ